MNIVVTGSLAYDRIMDFPGRWRDHILPDKIHILNVSFTLKRMQERFGGTAGNIAYNLRLLGLDPRIVSAVGSDFRRYYQYLNNLEVSVQHIKSFPSEFTAIANIITDLDDNQITAFYPGALDYGTEVEMPRDLRGENNFLIVAPSSPAEMFKRCQEAITDGNPFMFDPGQQITALSKETLELGALNSKISVFNDYEWQMFKNKTGLDFNSLTSRGVVVAVTQGEEGSVIYTKDGEYNISAVKVDKLEDPTGAGDAYRAGIALGFVNNWDWQTTGQVAATIASYVVEHYGTQEHRFTIEEFNGRYKENFGERSPLA